MNVERTFKQTTVNKLQVSGGVVSRLTQPVGNTSLPESRWRTYTSDSNTIVVTQSGESYFKAHTGQRGALGSVARRLHNFIREGRNLSTDDPFEYMEAATPTREEIGSGGEAKVYRIKDTDLVIKIRLNQGQVTKTREEYLEAAEAVSLALELEHQRDPSITQAVPIFMMIGPTQEQQGEDIDLDRPQMDLIIMPFVSGTSMDTYAEEAPNSAEKALRSDEYDNQIARIRDVVEKRVSRDIIPDPNSLDLSIQNIIRVEENGKVESWMVDFIT